MSQSLRAHTLTLFTIVVVLRLALAALVPIIQDETYYLAWSTVPDWGYFDHPPAVAWIGATAMLSWGSLLTGRLGTMVVAALAFVFVSGLLVHAGIRERSAHLAGLLLFNFNLFALGVGIFTTPDVALITAWCAALHEAAAALAGRRRRWIGAGIAVGLGLLSKYTMVLIGPVLLWALWRMDRQALRTPWPWLGGVLAVGILVPHLVWNANNQWVPVRFQLTHGFQGEFDRSIGMATRLPWAQPPGEVELLYSRWFLPGATVKPPAASAQSETTDVLAVLQQTAQYFGWVLVFWGALLVPMAQAALGVLRRRPRAPDSTNPAVRSLLMASAIVPLAFFAIASLWISIEPNWMALYIVGAAALFAASCGERLRVTIICAVVNAALVLSAAAYTRVPLGAGSNNRMLRETRGYHELALWLGALKGPIFADRHQLIAELNYHAPQLRVRQWPGLLRPSEYLRRAAWAPDTVESLRAAGGFWVVTRKAILRRLPGFQPVEAFAAHDCLGTGLVTVRAFSTAKFQKPCPGHAVHEWIVVRYNPVPGAG